jgi:hypothetical protein
MSRSVSPRASVSTGSDSPICAALLWRSCEVVGGDVRGHPVGPIGAVMAAPERRILAPDRMQRRNGLLIVGNGRLPSLGRDHRLRWWR